MKKTILFIAGLAFLTFRNQAQTTVTDYDGNIYNTVTIGTQVWMKENLKVTHYRNGDTIPNVTDGTAWGNLIIGEIGAYCNYNNDANNSTTYGRLYNWYAVYDNRNIAPTGWHVPTYTEWTTLTDYLTNNGFGYHGSGDDIAKSMASTAGWDTCTTAGTVGNDQTSNNSSSFTALPGGSRYYYGTFSSIGSGGSWWSSTGIYTGHSWAWKLYSSLNYVFNYDYVRETGFSVRCVMDSVTTKINEINYQNEIKTYPNPANDRVYINCAERQNVKMQIYNVVGECVLQRELSNRTNDIDISSLSKGIYIIKLTGTDWTVQRKLTKA